MPEIAHEMRKAYHWVPETDKLYLVINNAGDVEQMTQRVNIQKL